MVAVVAFFTWGITGYIVSRSSDTSIAVLYTICLLTVLAVSVIIGLSLAIPGQARSETAIRALLILLPSALIGVRTAYSRG